MKNPELVNQHQMPAQIINDVQLEESDEDPEFTVWETPEKAEEEARRQISEKYWWLSPDLQGKEPVEQFLIKAGADEVNLYNFSTQLSEAQRQEIQRAIGDLTRSKFKISNLKYILLKPDEIKHPFDDSLKMRGSSNKGQQAIRIYPEGLKDGDYRDGEVSGLSETRGIILHEAGHMLDEKFEDKLFPQNPDQCVTSYAKFNANEDLAETFCIYLAKPELLQSVSPEKFEFMEKYVGGGELKDVKIMKVEDVNLPRLEKPIKYQRRDPGVEIKIE